MKRMFLALVAAFVTATTVLFVGVASAQDDSQNTQKPDTANEDSSGEMTSSETTGTAGAEESAEIAGNRRRTVTRTRSFSNTQRITIPSTGTGPATADPYPSTINVDFGRRLRGARIVDMNLRLNDYSHTKPDDADVLLVGPRGQNAIVMSDVCGTTNVNNITLTLDDEAPTPLPSNGPCTTGTFRPTNRGGGDTFPAPAPPPNRDSALSIFDRTNPNGTWRLFVYDDDAGGTGRFASGWTLQIKAKGKKRRR